MKVREPCDNALATDIVEEGAQNFQWSGQDYSPCDIPDDLWSAGQDHSVNWQS